MGNIMKMVKQKTAVNKKKKAKEDEESVEYLPYRVKDPEPIDYQDGISEIFVNKHRVRIQKMEENQKLLMAKRAKRRMLGGKTMLSQELNVGSALS